MDAVLYLVLTCLLSPLSDTVPPFPLSLSLFFLHFMHCSVPGLAFPCSSDCRKLYKKWECDDGCQSYAYKQHIEKDQGIEVVIDKFLTDALTDAAITFLDTHLASAAAPPPFFLYLAYNAPHSPYEGAEPEYIDRFKHIPHKSVEWRNYAGCVRSIPLNNSLSLSFSLSLSLSLSLCRAGSMVAAPREKLWMASQTKSAENVPSPIPCYCTHTRTHCTHCTRFHD
jgi:hypothetical protein